MPMLSKVDLRNVLSEAMSVPLYLREDPIRLYIHF